MTYKGVYQQTYRQILWILLWSKKFTIQALYGRSTGNPLTGLMQLTMQEQSVSQTELPSVGAQRQVSGLDKRSETGALTTALSDT
jgi:hypothetical protein